MQRTQRISFMFPASAFHMTSRCRCRDNRNRQERQHQMTHRMGAAQVGIILPNFPDVSIRLSA
ncbi:protein of unknown function [Cupriavidus taiwanensis]|nr:protein of unknown function [Cupriavidus taiwanensis]